MTPKEKAKELVHKMWIYALPNAKGSWVNAKKLALIAVDEILNNFGLISESYIFYTSSSTRSFYEEVKIEIEKL
jgi:uncharacterized protein (UPF0262 family)